MNITIFYLSKKIIIKEKNQNTENQSFKTIDNLKKKEIIQEFEKFIEETNSETLIFLTENLKKGLEKFKKAFKFINAAGGLITKDNKFLFIYRYKRWDLPKGKLEMGESPEEAAIRECEEECGMNQLKITKALQPSYHIYSYKNGYALKKTYWYEMTTTFEGTFKPQLEENIESVVWFDKIQIKEQVLINSYPAIQHIVNTNILE